MREDEAISAVEGGAKVIQYNAQPAAPVAAGEPVALAWRELADDGTPLTDWIDGAPAPGTVPVLGGESIQVAWSAAPMENDDPQALPAPGLLAFANELISAALQGGDVSGADIQELAVTHGLLKLEHRDEACGEFCACAEHGFPAECYRKTFALAPSAAAHVGFDSASGESWGAVAGQPAVAQGDEAMDELRRSVAELLGQDPDTWPSHGNAPLAIASALALATSKAHEDEAVRDVLAERQRQVTDERFSPERDDAYTGGQLAAAGAAYAIIAHEMAESSSVVLPTCWPWDACWLKPSTPRRNLVKAGALIIAEIQRIDRAARRARSGETQHRQKAAQKLIPPSA